MPHDITDECKIYDFHGLELVNATSSQYRTECPFCNKHKLYINKENGMYSCKACGKKGNKFTFMTDYHKTMSRTSKDANEIALMRGISIGAVKKFDLRINCNGDVLVPVKKPGKKNLVNLRRWNPKQKISYNSPGCCTLFYAKWESKGPIYICEGEWDAICLYLMFVLTYGKESKEFKEVSIVGVPGANIFKDSWLEQFTDRPVNLIYDNDHNKKRNDGSTFNPAQEGMSMATEKLSAVTKDISVIKWSKVSTKKLSDGYDIRDHYRRAIKFKKIPIYLKKLLDGCVKQLIKIKDVAQATKKHQKDMSIKTFDQVVANFEKAYSVNQSFKDVLATCFACIVALKIPGNPLWAFLVAPPSSGKTSIIEAFEECYDFTEHVSKLSSTALVSGWNGGGGEDNEQSDPSILSRLKNKVLFIKDFTTILTMGTEKEKVFGLLRDAYDGSYIQHYGNGTTRKYNDLYFGIVAGVTHEIHAENKTSLGERFLKINLIDDDFDEDHHVLTALQNLGKKNIHKDMLKSTVNGFVENISHNDLPSFPEEMHERLLGISKFVAIVRTNVTRSRGLMTHRPESEVATRIATQLVKIACAYAMVLGKEKVDNACIRFVKKVALDSSIGFQLELVQYIEVLGHATADDLAQKMQMHPNSIRNYLKDAMEVGLFKIAKLPNGSGRRGNKAMHYSLSDRLERAMKTGRITFKKKKKRRTFSKRTKRSKVRNV